MKKDFSNFSFENSFSDRYSLVSVQIIFISKENGRIKLNLQPLLVKARRSEKNDPNLRNPILDKSVTPFIL